MTGPIAAYTRFDLTDAQPGTRVGVSCTQPAPLLEGDTITTTRFARVDRLTADDRGVCVEVTYDDSETETCHISRITYVDGKHVLP